MPRKPTVAPITAELSPHVAEFLNMRNALQPPPVELPELDTPTPAAPAVPSSTPGGDWRTSLSPAEAWIIQRESGFNPTAKNPKSTAFGIWQGLASTRRAYASRYGFDPDTTNPYEQLQMFRAYIKDRYGTAENAKAFWERNHWY